jgi:hypothetical protein
MHADLALGAGAARRLERDLDQDRAATLIHIDKRRRHIAASDQLVDGRRHRCGEAIDHLMVQQRGFILAGVPIRRTQHQHDLGGAIGRILIFLVLPVQLHATIRGQRYDQGPH